MKNLKPKQYFSKSQLSVFLIVFAVLGLVLLIKSLAAPNPSLPGDLNNDNTVNVTDMSILLTNYGTSNSSADINGDGAVNVLDMSILLSHYGESISATPSAPTGLAATAGDGSVALKWTANPSSENVDNYQLYWGTDSTLATFTYVASITGTSYNLTGLTNGTVYYFRVSAHNSAGFGPWGAIASATPQSAGGGTTAGVTPPSPPSAYTLPSSANSVAVSSTAQLVSAVGGSTRDIILENGTYTNGSSLMINSHRLWARNLGGATLQFGLQLGGNGSTSGAEVHGLKFDITNTAATFDNAAISIWGTTAGQNSGIFDSWFEGHHVLKWAIEDRITNDLKVQRSVISNFYDYGVFFETYNGSYYTDAPAIPPLITDLNISGIYESVRGASDGKAEAGIWAGTVATVSRVKIRDTGWQGIWTGGNANNGTYSDFDIDSVHGTVPSTGKPVSIGVYLEHYSRSNLFKNFVIGTSALTGISTGFNCEYADGSYAGTNPVAGQSISACHFNTFQDGTIYSSYLGFSLEDAEKTTIQRIKFVGQTKAAIKDFMTSGTGYTTIWQNLGNDFSGLAAGAVQYTQAH